MRRLTIPNSSSRNPNRRRRRHGRSEDKPNRHENEYGGEVDTGKRVQKFVPVK
jgi:hypothetical protein